MNSVGRIKTRQIKTIAFPAEKTDPNQTPWTPQYVRLARRYAPCPRASCNMAYLFARPDRSTDVSGLVCYLCCLSTHSLKFFFATETVASGKYYGVRAHGDTAELAGASIDR